MWPIKKIKGKHTLPRHKGKKRGVCVSTMNQNEGEQRHTHPMDEETKRGLRTVNTDGGGQKNAPARDEGTKRGLRTANTDGGR